MKLLIVGVLGLLAAPTTPASWTEQPTIAQQAWGDPALGVFGITLSTPTEGRLRAQDVIDGFRAAAAQAGIELGEAAVAGPELTTRFARGRWQGEAVLRVGDEQIELRACFHTDRRPERAGAECRAFMGGTP